MFGWVASAVGLVERDGAQRPQEKLQERKSSAQDQSKTREANADSHQELVEEIASLKESLRALQDSEQQYRSLFNENPQPMWIFDLRSLRFLAANKAALRQLGFNQQEFMGLTANRLLSPSALQLFMRDVAEPCAKARFRGRWHLCKRDGSLLEAEITALDLKYEGCPARLIVANEVTQHGRSESAPETGDNSKESVKAAQSLENLVPTVD
jgi:PAS domain S-box-containing protein